MFDEFKAFALRGSVIDMAVGIVMGAAFGTIINSFVEDILMPPIGLLLGGVNFTDLFVVIGQGTPAGPYTTLAGARDAGAVTMNIGVFMNAAISFAIVAVALYLVIRGINKLHEIGKKPAAEEEAQEKECPYCLSTIPIGASRCPFCTSELETSSPA